MNGDSAGIYGCRHRYGKPARAKANESSRVAEVHAVGPVAPLPEGSLTPVALTLRGPDANTAAVTLVES